MLTLMNVKKGFMTVFISKMISCIQERNKLNQNWEKYSKILRGFRDFSIFDIENGFESNGLNKRK